ncbi:MAG: hypothetical protein A2381_00345 [Bdellovibrionales bacterium RIFOXYB1_FULL_37_110]|nr:MAG: hypothetical protein A2417_11400 [Bdellovibrionales bacterium RIFOXYC1_FULL_37_79]OFZ60843.1 MAG: hypothetical protein A2381_00345 [Bdellovibrionales bacterium RIFOXYB1_FULL_37_110]OFZ62373.1 MAG: hypothetical protein A2577_03010 [Bdellovibrionales bacterium RIFOXYD1_FULL_36_51]
MVLEKNNNLFLIFIISFLLTPAADANSKLPVIKTKQNIANIRYISSDGKYTYYQRRTGELYFSSNYEVKEVLKGIEYNHYLVIGSESKKKLIISSWSNFQKFLSMREPATLHIVDYGTHLSQKIGNGISPRLHLNDEWLSFFDPKTKSILFQNLIHYEIKLNINLSNTINHYFIPEVIMPNKTTIIYTDIDKNGIPIVSHFNIPDQKFSLLYKPETHQTKIELCFLNDHVVIAEFGLDTLNEYSSIKRLAITQLENYAQAVNIYESKLNDIGNMICHMDKQIYFSKKIKKNATISNYEIASLNPDSKEVKIISDLKYAPQAFPMEDKIIIPHRGEFLLLVGKNIEYNDHIFGGKQ